MRTWLFVPGHDAHKTEKAISSEADTVIIDWEDAVPMDRKAEARSNAKALLSNISAARRCVIRINGTRTENFGDDLAALADMSGLLSGGLMLPKVGSPAEIKELVSHAAIAGIPIVPLVETALGVESAFAIAMAHPQVERLGFGALDFMADIGVEWTPDNPAYLYSRIRVSIAGRAAGLRGAIDGVYPLLQDYDGLRQDSAAARAAGYAGKMVLHPAQVSTVREVFSPTELEIERARTIIAAFREAQERGESAVRLGEGFIDPPVVLWAERLLAESEARSQTDNMEPQ